MDNDDGWVDKRLNMTISDRAGLAKSVMPIQHILVKVGTCLAMCTSGQRANIWTYNVDFKL